MHTFTSNSSVTINAVTQETGIVRGEIYNAVVGKISDGFVNIESTFLKDDDGSPVHHQHFQVSEADFDTFEATQTLTETTVFGRFEELCSLYVISQLEGLWGLTSTDWTLNAH